MTDTTARCDHFAVNRQRTIWACTARGPSHIPRFIVEPEWGRRRVTVLKEQLESELYEAGIGALIGTGDDAKVGVIADAANSIWGGKLGSVEYIEELHPNFDSHPVLRAKQDSLECGCVEVAHSIGT